MNINIATNIKINKHLSTTLFAMQISYWQKKSVTNKKLILEIAEGVFMRF